MSDLPEIYAGGEIRKLGNVVDPTQPKLMVRAIENLPEAEWVEFDLRDLNAPIDMLDQNGIGACNGHAMSTGLEWARFLAGMSHVDLSPWFPYSIMCGGVDRGSNIGQALELGKKTGTCRFESVPWKTYNPRKLTAANYEEAKNFKIEIGEMLPDFNAMMTATQLRRPFNFSICVGSNFNPGGNGIVGYSRGAGNHAVCGGLGAKRINGKWYILFQNSWTDKWGMDGFAYVGREHIDGQPWFESYTIISANDLSGDERNPPRAA